jgi:hypothetical protein
MSSFDVGLEREDEERAAKAAGIAVYLNQSRGDEPTRKQAHGSVAACRVGLTTAEVGSKAIGTRGNSKTAGIRPSRAV